MKKNLLVLVLSLFCFITFVGCNASKTYEIALVTDSGTINDESFNQAAWLGIKDYAEKNSVSYKYFQPVKASDQERMNSIDQACKAGAKIVVLPGYLFEGVICDASTKYPNVKFLLLDGSYKNDAGQDKDGFGVGYDSTKEYNNVYCVYYQEEQSGYLAGYAAVMDGYTKLGFLGGMAVPAVKRFGYGYLQGANKAAEEKKVNVTCKYYYAGQFFSTDTSNALMKTWVEGGTEVIFACGGGVYTSAKDAIISKGKGKMIGVDVDQSKVGDFVITSAMKGLKETVISTLTALYNEKWDTLAGKVDNLGLGIKDAPTDYVGLPTADSSWKFKSFTKDNYNTLLGKIRDNSYTINNTFEDVNSSEELKTLLGLTNLTVEYSK